MPQLVGHPGLCTCNPNKKVVIGKAIPEHCKHLWNEDECKFGIEKKLLSLHLYKLFADF